ncbi:MliC family protein [Sphingomonas sp. BGYR3]|uniref:MliC family protein n=1 Tax=Sphingomonas sp. BGYR3 TaxID=2975483 RepID=UPI0021A3FE55|nr:MliC family protein [Sphingomonas sp. BGYR3]MDG5487855.1 MliC family protein [Sphingomonas sp. BGYR3]
MKLRIIAALAGMGMLAGCMQPIGTPGGSSFYECSQGTRLRVDYRDRGAIVRVNDSQTIVMRAAASLQGESYEGLAGQRLQRNGSSVQWNTAARTAPETCRQIAVPR